MQLIFIVIGAAVGAWAGDAGEELLGMLVGVLLGSLLFRLGNAQTQIEQLTALTEALLNRVESLEKEVSGISENE